MEFYPVPAEIMARIVPRNPPPPPVQAGEAIPPYIGTLVPKSDYPRLYHAEGKDHGHHE